MRKLKKNKQQKSIKVAISGGFDPVHVGHIRLFQGAKKLGNRLIVILNNDNWLLEKKGYVFMPEQERKELLKAFKDVDEVILSSHPKNPKDMSVCKELLKIKPDIFANGGDRYPKNIPVPEVKTCQAIDCKMLYNVGKGGKIQSSSWLSQNFLHSSKNNKNRPE